MLSARASSLAAVLGACEGLAYVFFLVAENRDRGRSREEQIERARESVVNPFAAEPRQAGNDLIHVIDLVYRQPEASASEIESQVRDDCEVDDNGHAVLRTLWPARRAADP
jgi:hypothetical protein